MPNIFTFRSKTGHKHRSAKGPASSPRPSDFSTFAKRLNLRSIPRAVRAQWRRRDPLPHSITCASTPHFRALVIGLSYEGNREGWEHLRGSHGDARNFARLLHGTYGWNMKDVTLMMDAPKYRNTKFWPTKANMEAQMEELVDGAQAGDMLVIFYAGHSGQVPAEKDTREIDGFDEHMISIDGKNILDDRLRELLVEPLRNGTRLTAVFDSCHSGTLLDLEIYPIHSIKSELDYKRTTPDIEKVARANSLPAFLPAHIVHATRGAKKLSWMAIKAILKLYAAARRNTQGQALGTEQALKVVGQAPRTDQIPVIVVDTEPGDATTLDMLDIGIAASDVSSILTDTLPEIPVDKRSSQREAKSTAGASASAPKGAKKPTAKKPRMCHHCRWLETQRPIVNSIAACLDGQQAGERPRENAKRKSAGIMSSALIKLLGENPKLSCREIKEKLQPKIFEICCEIAKGMGQKETGGCEEICWQMLQPGSEHDEHLNEPLLLFAPGKKDSRP